jgi:glutathione S-transferase
MALDRRVTLYHSPNTRSTGVLFLLEEIGTLYDLEVVDMKAGAQRQRKYLAINPMGKVPALKHGDALVTEQVAICLYLADLFPEARLAPSLGDPLRGPYLRWMVLYAACFEPALVDRALGREPGPAAMSPYGDWDTLLATVTEQLSEGRYLLGPRICAADLLWGMGLAWARSTDLVPDAPPIRRYVDEITARPAMKRAREKDAEIAAARG